MNISSIKAGDTFRNYKQLCEVLEIEPKTSNSKKAQLKEMERYFKYEKVGNKYNIISIYNVPLPENNNKTKYIQTIEKLILDKLVQEDNNGHIFISKNNLLEELKMINENYTYAKYKQLRLSKHMNISIEEIEEFYLTSDDLLKRNIESALNGLRNQSLIFWTNAITLCFIDTQAETTEYNNKIKANKQTTINSLGEESTTFYSNVPKVYRRYRKATKEEVSLILEIERDIMKKYNCESIQDIYKKGYANKFYSEVKEILFNIANIYFYFNSYEIIANEKYILDKWEELQKFELELEEREQEKEDLNFDIMFKIRSNAEKRAEKANNKMVWYSDTQKTKVHMRIDNEYLNNNKRLTNTLINKDAEPIKDKLKRIK
jgi:hypothetical protein